MKNKSRGVVKTITRMAISVGGSYFGSKVACWVFDNLLDRQSK
jgi:hypothetical protein